LIVNPVAGLGGRVGLKGSDGADIQQRARALGAVPEATNRAVDALKPLTFLEPPPAVITYPAEMGENATRLCGFSPVVIGSIRSGRTTPEDTRLAAQQLRDQGVDLILFAGGDGTARDIYHAVGDSVPVLGIPAGVKIHSAVYAINPTSAGDLAAMFLSAAVTTLREAEVMDLDEDAYRQGIVSPRLYGYLNIPAHRRFVQARKSPSPPSEANILQAIALHVVDHMRDDVFYIIGPGTTTRPILSALNLPKTLIGVDVVQQRKIVAVDANESTLLKLLDAPGLAQIVVTPIGGQGFVFGRGNQQISPAVIRRVGRENIHVVSTWAKLESLRGHPLLVDTGDPAVDHLLSGHIRIITGYNEHIVYRVGTG
jgi:predicted polyphosphate/ATP-dependent NAD kinase